MTDDFEQLKKQLNERTEILKSMKHKCFICEKLFPIKKLIAQIQDDLTYKYICKKCLKKDLKQLKVKKPKTQIDIEVKTTVRNGKEINRTHYNILENTIRLHNQQEHSIICDLSHETVHGVLMKIEGYNACTQFDTIAYLAKTYGLNEIAYGVVF